MSYDGGSPEATGKSDAILTKIRKLLAQAEDPAVTEAEAQSFNDKAAELIARYGIDQALLAAEDPDLDIVGDRVVVLDAPYAREKSELLAAVGRELGCRSVFRTRYPDGRKQFSIHLFGHRSNLERTEILFTSLLVQAAHALATVAVPAWEHKAAFRRTWLAGFTRSVGARLACAETKVRDEAERLRTPEQARSVALVLADRSHEVDDALQAAYPRLGTSSRRKLSGGGYQSGWSAGQRADLGGRKVHDRGARAIGR